MYTKKIKKVLNYKSSKNNGHKTVVVVVVVVAATITQNSVPNQGVE